MQANSIISMPLCLAAHIVFTYLLTCAQVVVSHSQDFLNGVCTNIMNLTNKKKVRCIQVLYEHPLMDLFC